MSKHVVIVGAGVIGLSAGYYLSRRGHRVTILDRGGSADEGCSFGNAGMIVPSHFVPLAAPGMVGMAFKMMWDRRSPFYIKPRWSPELLKWGWKFWRSANAGHVARAAPVLRDLSLASRAAYAELATSAEFGLEKKGLLMLCKTEHGLEEEARTAERARELGIPADVLDAKGAAAMEPEIRMDVAGAVYFPLDCHLSPGRLMAALREQIEAAGGEIRWDTDVTGWRATGGRVEAVRTSGGEVAGDEFVLCGGSWSPQSVRELGLTLPMQAGKGYSVTLEHPRTLPRTCAILTEARVAVTPMGGTLRFGGTMEIAGLDRSINPERVEGIVRSVPTYYPEFEPGDFAGLKPWCGLRPCSPDGLPYLGRTRAAANLVVATGHAMMGLSLGPVTGKTVAELVDGERPGVDIGMLSPDRYA